MDYQDFAQEAFSRKDLTNQDFQVLAASVRLFYLLPSTHGVTSMVKILRGVSESNNEIPEYGTGKDYTTKELKDLLNAVEEFLYDEDFIDDDEKAEDEMYEETGSEWLRVRKVNKPELCALSDKILEIGLSCPNTVRETRTIPNRKVALKVKDWSKIIQNDLKAKPEISSAFKGSGRFDPIYIDSYEKDGKNCKAHWTQPDGTIRTVFRGAGFWNALICCVEKDGFPISISYYLTTFVDVGNWQPNANTCHLAIPAFVSTLNKIV